MAKKKNTKNTKKSKTNQKTIKLQKGTICFVAGSGCSRNVELLHLGRNPRLRLAYGAILFVL